MKAMLRLDAEAEFHDLQAAKRSESFRNGQANLKFSDQEFLDHETWIRPAFRKLGSMKGKVALDYGCGHGMAAIVMARARAQVTAFDLSAGYVREAAARAIANNVSVECIQANAEQLPFPDAKFDIIWGNAILHHLDMTEAGRELIRVMRPGGVAVFCEPWGENPLLRFARRFLPYPGKGRTIDERPLRRNDLDPLKSLFKSVDIQGFQLFGMVQRVWRNTNVWSSSHKFDDRLLRLAPKLNNLCRYVVVTMRK